MLDKLIDFLLGIIEKVIPVYIIKEYEQGVFFRFGRYKKDCFPGLHWKLPFIDEIDSYPVVTTTLTLPAQSIITSDGVAVVIKTHIKYKISNIKIYAIEVADAIDALSDMTSGINYVVVHSRTYQETCEHDIEKIITKEAKKEAKKWGIEIEKVTISDYSKINSLRLFNEQASLI